MRGSELVSEHFWAFDMIEVEGGWIEFKDDELYKRLNKSEKAKLLHQAQEVLDKAEKRKRTFEKKPRRADKKVTMKEFEMLVEDVLNTDLPQNFDGKIKDVYDIITLPSVQSEKVDAKANPLSAKGKEKI